MAEKTWDGLKALSALIASVFIPIAVAFIGNEYSKAIEQSNRETTAAVAEADRQASYIEMAVGILSVEPSAENRNLRAWATDVINTYAEVKMDTAVTRQLQTKVKLLPPEYQFRQELIDPRRLNLDRMRPNLTPQNP